MTLRALLPIVCLVRGTNGEQSAWSDARIFNLPKFQSLLDSRHLCRSVVYRQVTTTTMDLAARELREGAPHGTMVLTEEMTQGKGRTGKWISPKDGNLYLTVLLRAGELDLSSNRRAQANYATPLAVAEAIKSLEPGLDVRIRWPLSVEVDSQKVSGSLIETHEENGLEHYAVGIGVNVNADFCENQTFSQDVTSLRCVAKKSVDREELLSKICNTLDDSLRSQTAQTLKQKYLSWPSVTAMSSEVSLHNKQTKEYIADGVVMDLTEDLSLVIRLTNGSRVEVSSAAMMSVLPRGRLYKTEL